MGFADNTAPVINQAERTRPFGGDERTPFKAGNTIRALSPRPVGAGKRPQKKLFPLRLGARNPERAGECVTVRCTHKVRPPAPARHVHL